MEKINIYVPENIGVMLENDAVMFEVYKKDGRTVNRNRFLGMLITGYYGDYITEIRNAYDTIVSSIETAKLSVREKEQIAESILKNYVLPIVPSRKGKNPTRLSLKPTKDTETLIQQIMIDLIVDDDLKDKIDNSSLFSYSDYCIKDQNSDAYSITVPKLTYKEIQLIMKNIPMTELEYAQDKDSFYGISYKEIDNFQRIYRYYPYYVESSMNT